MASRGQVVRLYRHIMKAAKEYPSIKRDTIIEDIRLEFRQNKVLTNPDAVRKGMEVGIRSLEQLEAYSKMDKHGTDWEVYLKGSCD